MIIALPKRWSTKPWKHDHFIPQAWSLSSWKDDQNNHETMIMMSVQVIHRNPWLPRSWFVDPLLLWVFRGCGSMIKLRLFHLSLPSIVAKLAKRLKWRQFWSLASKIAWLSELTEAWSWKTLCLVCRYCISSFRGWEAHLCVNPPFRLHSAVNSALKSMLPRNLLAWSFFREMDPCTQALIYLHSSIICHDHAFVFTVIFENMIKSLPWSWFRSYSLSFRWFCFGCMIKVVTRHDFLSFPPQSVCKWFKSIEIT